MNCLHAMAPGDEDILKYVLDEAALSQEARAHVDQCSICQQRLTRYKDMHSFLLSKFYRYQCPDSLQLSLYCANALSEKERMQVAAHIIYCPLCTQEVADTRSFLTDTDLVAAPSPSLQDAVRRIIATLIPAQPAYVTRSAITTTTWPRQYRAEAFSFLLGLSPDKHGGTNSLVGTLSHVSETISLDVAEGKEAQLYRLPEHDYPDTPFALALIDDLGSFILPGIPDGTYRLLVHLPDCELIVDELVIKAE
jgi:hypothetical protein